MSESDVGFSTGSHSHQNFRAIGDGNPVLEHVPQHEFVIGCERQIEPIASALPVDLPANGKGRMRRHPSAEETFRIVRSGFPQTYDLIGVCSVHKNQEYTVSL